MGLRASARRSGAPGVFQEGAELVLDFAFETLGVHRLEARAAVANGRGNGALRKIGAVQEGLLRKSFLRNGEYLDQVLYAIVEDDWRADRDHASRVHGGRQQGRLMERAAGAHGECRPGASGLLFRRMDQCSLCVLICHMWSRWHTNSVDPLFSSCFLIFRGL